MVLRRWQTLRNDRKIVSSSSSSIIRYTVRMGNVRRDKAILSDINILCFMCHKMPFNDIYRSLSFKFIFRIVGNNKFLLFVQLSVYGDDVKYVMNNTIHK